MSKANVKYFVKVIAFKDDVTKSPYQLTSQAGTGTATVVSGVPQGPMMGPVFFTLYLFPLSFKIKLNW